MGRDPINEGQLDGDDPFPAAVSPFEYPTREELAQIVHADEALRRVLEHVRTSSERARQTDRTDDHVSASTAWIAAKEMFQAMSFAFLDVEMSRAKGS